MKNLIFTVLLLALCSPSLFAQAPSSDPQPSLADIARQTRENKAKAKAKVVVTDETMAASKGPIPEIVFVGQDNAKEIIRAIEAYKTTHTPEQTEAMIRDWYENEDAQLEHAINENIELNDRARNLYYTASQDPSPTSPKQYRERQSTQAQRIQADRQTVQTNGLHSARLQHELEAVRYGIRPLVFDWFKIRCGNGNCSY